MYHHACSIASNFLENLYEMFLGCGSGILYDGEMTAASTLTNI